jgi:hypothetical protein
VTVRPTTDRCQQIREVWRKGTSGKGLCKGGRTSKPKAGVHLQLLITEGTHASTDHSIQRQNTLGVRGEGRVDWRSSEAGDEDSS